MSIRLAALLVVLAVSSARAAPARAAKASPADPAPAPAAPPAAAATPEPARPRPNSLAIMDTVAQSAPDALAALVTQTLGSYAANSLGFDVVAKDDVRRLIALEQQKQLLGCEAETCTQAGNIGSALGAEKLVTSTLGKVGERFQLSVVVMDVATSRVAGRATREVRTEEELVENARDLLHFALKHEERESKGYLRLSVSRPGARIVVDGAEIGVSPLQTPLRLPAGRHTVHVERDGFIPADATVDIEAGRESPVEFVLVAKSDIKVAGSGYLPWAWATLGVAVAGAAASTWFYLDAKNIYETNYMADAVTQSELDAAREQVDFRGNTLHFYTAIGSGVLGGVSAVLFSAYFISGLGNGAGGDEPRLEPRIDGFSLRF